MSHYEEFWQMGQGVCVVCDARGKKKIITWTFAMCASCIEEFSSDRTTWPKWLVWLVREYQREHKQFERGCYIETISLEEAFPDPDDE